MPTPLRSGRGPVTARSTRFLSALKQAHVVQPRAPASAQGERRPLSARSGSGIHFRHAAWPQHRALTAAVDCLQSVREIAADPPQAPNGCEAVFSMCRQAVGVPTAALPLSCIPLPHPSTALSCLSTRQTSRTRNRSSNVIAPGDDRDRMRRERHEPLSPNSSERCLAFPVEIVG